MPSRKSVAFLLVWSFISTSCQAFNVLQRVSPKAPLKQQLLQLCRQKPERATIESYVDQLAPLSPVQATAASPLLQKKWKLQYTTEKEINLFIDQGWSPPGSIYQIIDGNRLENCIPFVNGGSLGVQGTLSIPDRAGQRTNFVFSEATLDLGRWGSYRIPPVGQGWFDTLYLDRDLRIDINSRNDLLICTAER
ncbi:hypothetical protein FisN_29Hh111 [Fistulifera solaris]|jgi:hypothetical protein|uniref:Plastid lipid-associated protein/fibrillin conserved domain-containing protein n=1 Tax=Fistulifera solaris TaxID=1519565 RepID=A0A1Z5K687_FISSO|nr:hypothetical protein FisN_29Hh111 [Fistulifera solaris]|eukprot:GAX21672.1 hypothetical protein FisN_29Hh111 [Fistulifera solaris]